LACIFITAFARLQKVGKKLKSSVGSTYEDKNMLHGLRNDLIKAVKGKNMVKITKMTAHIVVSVATSI
jgi:uncharacterized protein YbcI